MPSPLKPVIWLGDSLRELEALTTAVQDEIGYAHYLAQCGQKHVGQAAEGSGVGSAGGSVDHRGDTFRFAVYTVRFADRVFVLGAFQKKSKTGVATPKTDIDLIRQRLKQAVYIVRSRRGQHAMGRTYRFSPVRSP